MDQELKFLGIPGSLRQGSYNHGALRAAQEIRPSLEIFDLRDIPLFDQDAEGSPPEAVVSLKQKVRDCDAVILATPEYNYSFSGVLKNAIDWGSRPFGDSAWYGKPVGVMGASLGALGTARAQSHLRQVFVFLNMYPLNQPELLIGDAMSKFDDDGNLTDEYTRDRIEKFLTALTEWTHLLKVAPAAMAS
jgi:chromate reductase